MGLKSEYTIDRMDKASVKEWLIHKHYADGIPSIVYSFGLYNDKNIPVGACCYGSPANSFNNRLGGFDCIELVRLVTDDDLPKNALSYFVAGTFDMLHSPIVLISYADQGRGHHGYIYQATNWIYTGLGGGVDFYRTNSGKEVHSRIMSDYRKRHPDKTRSEIAEMLRWEKIKGTMKHRYFYFLGNKTEKRLMRSALLERYTIEQYPKGDNERYDASYEPAKQARLGI